MKKPWDKPIIHSPLSHLLLEAPPSVSGRPFSDQTDFQEVSCHTDQTPLFLILFNNLKNPFRSKNSIKVNVIYMYRLLYSLSDLQNFLVYCGQFKTTTDRVASVIPHNPPQSSSPFLTQFSLPIC